jgi:hypothetical protein
LIGSDAEPADVALELREQLMKRIGEGCSTEFDPSGFPLPLMAEPDA